ncbi:M48 family metallopeptidase [Massilia antarctica]|uniref:M48 family metallopeptidase n=1 Tax=Massilia antarctica TaxID=2765360 RepID=UPI0006BB8030|nr:M48 family metallopeptidase [Massilia sp. H27-R4]MCY0911318.1 M48 family metallopeptidase [Massilia sp. H27-R4]CUI05081.1 Putative Zn-dependent protease, contains TPR repeats [Janthinobacterium sp. CG23_2]CUU28867.1 Putative Zn-dependent protease, contains TPR repeats [Janthinobacterium sp. CG23_2]
MARFTGLRPAMPVICLALLLSACETTGPAPEPTPTVPVPQTPAEPPPRVVTPRLAAAADALTRMAALQERLYRIAAPLLINNADLCKSSTRNLLGFTARNRYWYPGEYNEAANIAFDMGERLQVTGVLAGSGAARAGLRRGDNLISASGKALPVGPNASSTVGAVFGPLVASHASLALQIERDDKTRELTIPVTRACGFVIELGNADNVNSYADGQRVMVTRGMLQFAKNDDEVAYLLAKGMAHNILGHAASQRSTGTIGSIIDNLTNVRPDTSMLIGSGGIKAMPPELDAAADQLSMYLLVRASVGIDSAPAFWKRLAATYPATVLNSYVANHPGTSARLAAIDKATADIRAKQVAKKTVAP